jgi:hypothetical protein
VTETTATRSYRPGQWFGIFGSHATVLLPPTEKDRVGRLWALVDDGAGFDVVLDALIAEGLRDLPGFVLVSEDEGETKVVIRGAARAEFTAAGETVTVEGSGVTTWQERSLRDVATMRIEVAEGGGEDLAITDGLVRISRIDRPAAVAATEVAEGAEVAEVAEDVTGEDADATGDDLPVVPDDETTSYPSAPAPPAEIAAELPPGSWDLAGVVAPAPVAVARLTFSNGDVVDVDQVVLVGRAPEASRSAATDGPVRLVTVPSPHQEISSTHLELRPGSGADQGQAVVTDLGSTNGTVLQQPGAHPEDLRPGVGVAVAPGAFIDLGDGVTIQVDPV